ncbi:MAG: thiol oxidoreductase [Chlorobi bacterium]|nr:thiol oxidoreductase [Chlorobiota bacterium]MCI0716627.1 thiol oxidoreductase [Chlorobiota bacterium]
MSKKYIYNYLVIFSLSLALVAVFHSCDFFLTPPVADDETLDGPIEGLTSDQLRMFFLGDEQFNKVFSFNEGLGPIFNNTACGSCHVDDGKSHPSANLKRFQKNLGNGTYDPLTELGGLQLQDKSIPGYPAETIPPEANAISVRSGPIVVGLGLIEAISDSTILAYADPNDQNNDGISGKPQLISAPSFLNLPPGPYGGKYLGRFGRKAGAINLLQQTVEAYHQDIGITTDLIPSENYNPLAGGYIDPVPDPEVTSNTVQFVVFYLKTLKPPIRRMQNDLKVIAGNTKFNEIGCNRCHVPSMQTGYSPINALSYKQVNLYSDMLLHDMGDELADNFIEGKANEREWRTTPLWGLGIIHNATGGMPFYMHDGRTSDLIEAIRLHGGEAEAIKQAFMNLGETDRQNVIAFLKSL